MIKVYMIQPVRVYDELTGLLVQSFEPDNVYEVNRAENGKDFISPEGIIILAQEASALH